MEEDKSDENRDSPRKPCMTACTTSSSVRSFFHAVPYMMGGICICNFSTSHEWGRTELGVCLCVCAGREDTRTRMQHTHAHIQPAV